MGTGALAWRLVPLLLLGFGRRCRSGLDPGDFYLLSLDADGLSLFDGPFRRRDPNDLWALLAK
jgi:hypothetical protein